MNAHDSFEPKLRIRASGYEGSGYALPHLKDPDTDKFRKVPGVTTVLNVLPKDAITQWAVDNTVAYMIANVDTILDLEESVAYRKYRWYHSRKPEPDSQDANPYNHHAGVLHDAADRGTWAHDWVESRWLGLFEPDPLNEEHEEMIQAYLKFESENEIEPILVETTVVNEEYGYAGTLDGIVLLNGVPTLLDIKTSRAVYESHVAQLAAIQQAEYGMLQVYGENPDAVPYKTSKWGLTKWVTQEIPSYEQVGVLQLRPSDFDSKTGEYIEPFCEFHLLTQDQLDAGWGLFTSCLTLQHARKNWKDVKKAHDRDN